MRQPRIWTELAGLGSELCFRLCPVMLNIEAREGSFRLQSPPPQAGKSMPAPLEAAMVPADLPTSLQIRVRDWTLPKPRCPDS